MLDAQLRTAYYQTHYYFADIQLKIDKISSQTRQLLQSFSPKGGVFITAWNPWGEVKSIHENHEANLALKADLISQGLMVIEGYGESPDGTWREDSFFAYPVDEQASRQLCQKYQQNAVVYVDSSGMAKLVFIDNKYA